MHCLISHYNDPPTLRIGYSVMVILDMILVNLNILRSLPTHVFKPAQSIFQNNLHNINHISTKKPSLPSITMKFSYSLLPLIPLAAANELPLRPRLLRNLLRVGSLGLRFVDLECVGVRVRAIVIFARHVDDIWCDQDSGRVWSNPVIGPPCVWGRHG